MSGQLFFYGCALLIIIMVIVTKIRSSKVFKKDTTDYENVG
jgi:hypothetical protein